MPRPKRLDRPGAFHHIGNRGVNRRPMFLSRTDVRYFLSLLAREVRAGRIAILAFCVLTNHFHLLVESLRGEISGVMQRVMNQYVRRFNRRKGLDGSLCTARFWSRPVDSEAYRRAVVRYIDQNAPEARLSHRSADYPYGSAVHYRSTRRPRWLSTEWVDRWARSSTAADEGPDAPLVPDAIELVELRLRQPPSGSDRLDDLLGAARPRVRAWLERCASRSGDSRSGVALVAPGRVERSVASVERRRGPRSVRLEGARTRSAWPVSAAGLLHDLAALSPTEIAARLRQPPTSTRRYLQIHRRAMAEDEAYASCVTEIAAACLARPPAA